MTHKTIDGWCCACDVDQAFAESWVIESLLADLERYTARHDKKFVDWAKDWLTVYGKEPSSKGGKVMSSKKEL